MIDAREEGEGERKGGRSGPARIEKCVLCTYIWRICKISERRNFEFDQKKIHFGAGCPPVKKYYYRDIVMHVCIMEGWGLRLLKKN